MECVQLLLGDQRYAREVNIFVSRLLDDFANFFGGRGIFDIWGIKGMNLCDCKDLRERVSCIHGSSIAISLKVAGINACCV